MVVARIMLLEHFEKQVDWRHAQEAKLPELGHRLPVGYEPWL